MPMRSPEVRIRATDTVSVTRGRIACPIQLSPSNSDHDFVTRFPEYVDSAHRITVTEELFKTNVERPMALVTWVGECLDSRVQLLTEPRQVFHPHRPSDVFVNRFRFVPKTAVWTYHAMARIQAGAIMASALPCRSVARR